MAPCEMFVNIGPHGGWKFQKATSPTIFIGSQPNFMKTLAAMVGYRLLLFLTVGQVLIML